MEAPMAQGVAASAATITASSSTTNGTTSPWSNKYRGVGLEYTSLRSQLNSLQATVEDLDPPPALSTSPFSAISSALITAFERDYTHLTVIHPESKSLLGYVSIPRLKQQLESKAVGENDPVEKAMTKFQRKGRRYRLITMETTLEELEAFFNGDGMVEKQDFAVVTDPARRFVLGVATKGDLEEFVRRRPG